VKRNTRNAQGFTLVELMVVIALMGLLFNLGVARYIDFNRRQSVVAQGLKLKNNLRSIQQNALSGVKPATGCTVLEGYVIHFHTTDLRQFLFCTPQHTILTLSDIASEPALKIFPLPSNFRYGTTIGGAFQDASHIKHVLFKVLGSGIAIYEGSPSGNFLPAVTSQLITIRAFANPYRYYSVCLAGGGDIKDCGYRTGSPPVCTCP